MIAKSEREPLKRGDTPAIVPLIAHATGAPGSRVGSSVPKRTPGTRPFLGAARSKRSGCARLTGPAGAATATSETFAPTRSGNGPVRYTAHLGSPEGTKVSTATARILLAPTAPLTR